MKCNEVHYGPIVREEGPRGSYGFMPPKPDVPRPVFNGRAFLDAKKGRTLNSIVLKLFDDYYDARGPTLERSKMDEGFSLVPTMARKLIEPVPISLFVFSPFNSLIFPL